jgi:hypothetical protein
MSDSLPVILNVYKISENSLIEKFGIELYHTAIEYDNTEFAFGYLNKADVSGVYDIKPMSFDQGSYVESITLGNVKRREFFNKLDIIKNSFMGNSYNLLTKNCNHFTKDFVKSILDIDIPFKFKTFLSIGEFIRKFITF